VQTKEQILKYLRDSFVFAHRAIAAINSQNMLLPVKRAPNRAGRYHVGVGRLRLLARERHLRQMVEYLRMNGIVPPASVNSHMPLPE